MLDNEALIRSGVFVALLATLVLVEFWRPRRTLTGHRVRRWPTNIGLVAIDTLLIRMLAPGLTIAAAVLADRRGWGLFTSFDALPTWVIVVLCIVLLDCFIYWQHRIMHAVPVLWRLHRVHHADVEFDVTTALRFHPLEIALSLALKSIVIVALGAPVAAVVTFEVLLNASAMFNHANIALPSGVDRFVRKFVVTPDMHRVHHSDEVMLTNSNYGFFLSLWDRVFASYVANPTQPHETMRIGLQSFREPDEQTLTQLLIQPFRKT